MEPTYGAILNEDDEQVDIYEDENAILHLTREVRTLLKINWKQFKKTFLDGTHLWSNFE